MAYEPIIVTTLRRYHRRGAPQSLCERIAGGARCWRMLNEWWDLEGAGTVRAAPSRGTVELVGALDGLSGPERRIALRQLAAECDRAGKALPPIADLASYFAVRRAALVCDLALLSDRALGDP